MKAKDFFSNLQFQHDQLDFSFYQNAKNNDFFAKKKAKKVFSMVLPPPNVTGILHIGHALNMSVSDTIARFYHLRDYQVRWIPGTDHAGIATQAKFEQILKQQNKSIKDYPSRDAFYQDVYQWAIEQQKKIISQSENLVPLLNWKKAFFTLDKYVNQNVNHVFVKLYEQKLLYQDNKMINWDVGLKTAISDIEVVHKPQKSQLYYIKYQLSDDSKKSLIVATTRPETMFGDTCLFVNPKDKRYQAYVGKKVINPANGELIPIMADTYVDQTFATGVMKCTPAHDYNDYELGKKHHLKIVTVMNLDGTMNEKANQFAGLDRHECREKLVQFLKDNNHLEKIETIENVVGYSSRSDQQIEPMISLQWFIKVKPIIKQIQALQKKSTTMVNLVPPRFNKILRRWLATMNDWCISRQLIWGHQLPVYYDKKTGAMVVSEEKMSAKLYTRDTNVLDTWFSSALWPFVCMKYEPNTKNDFFPNSLLVTGSDIIFFWVARMMLMSTFYTGKNPFKHVLITGIVRDNQGRKMSKSLNNGIDPNVLINQYGVDALRLYLVTSTSAGEDLNYQESRLQYTWNFLNKLWNSTRFIFQQIDPEVVTDYEFDTKNLSIFDQWILAKLFATCQQVERNFTKYNFTVVGKCIIDFFWNDFCNNYLEIAKIYLKNGINVSNVQKILFYVMKYVVLLLHPFCPIITENIYTYLPLAKANILLEDFVLPKRFSVPAKVQTIFDFIVFIRQIRTNFMLKPKDQLLVYLDKKNFDMVTRLKINDVVNKLTNINLASYDANKVNVDNLVSFVSSLGLIYVEVDISDESWTNQMHKRLANCEFELSRAQGILKNVNFVKNAPKEKVQAEEEKVKKYADEISQLKKLLKK